ncbi:MAG: hypothetical protein AABY07_00190, partial [Nanoarchaeota archaeon]
MSVIKMINKTEKQLLSLAGFYSGCACSNSECEHCEDALSNFCECHHLEEKSDALSLLQQPRCGLADRKALGLIQGYRWNKRDL